MEVSPATLDRVHECYGRGLYLQAFETAREAGPIASWTGTAARLIGGRLAWNTGASRLGNWLITQAWRRDRASPEAFYYRMLVVFGRHGPLAAWNLLKARGDPVEARPEIRADLWAIRARSAAVLRDFEAADACLRRAEEIVPGRAWTGVERSDVLELEDRYEDSLAAAREALASRPWYRPAVQATAHALMLLDRNPEALELLQEADRRLESGLVALMLADLQAEMGLHAQARLTLDRVVHLMPLADEAFTKLLAARQADAAYFAGDLQAAAEFGRRSEFPFHRRMAENLTRSPAPEPRRVHLPVRFVRQHHLTCSPATLTAISHFWGVPAEHLDVAGEICYDGTPSHSEREWADRHGLEAREFTVTPESAQELLDLGIPYTLTTTEPGNGHLQAVVGYDRIRGTLLIRDPTIPRTGEFIVDATLQRYRSTGPRGMVLLPRAEAGKISSLALPDAPAYDRLYAVQRALKNHDRPAARAACDALAAEHPGHRLSLQARYAIATYDGDRTEALATLERQQALFPDDGCIRLFRLACLQDLDRRDERLALLRQWVESAEAPPIASTMLARELQGDARERDTAERFLRRSIRACPQDAPAYRCLADLRWSQRRFEEATELYRFAACLDDRNESCSMACFTATRHLRRTDEALRFLEGRCRILQQRSGGPAATLFQALDQLERTHEAFEVLDRALAIRPEDGDLHLFAAEARARFGEMERAKQHLGAARGRSREVSWLRSAAYLAGVQGDIVAACERWKEVVAAEPLHLPSQQEVARLLAETRGRPAALDHLKATAARFPHHSDLHALWIEWLRPEGPGAVEPVARKLVETNPANAWARRELALALARLGRREEAQSEAAQAHLLEPMVPGSGCMRGTLASLAGRFDEARAAFREAILLSVDVVYAQSELLSLCTTTAERREALSFIRGELGRQAVFGEGLLAWRALAGDTLSPEELLAALRESLAARPDRWDSWSAVILQLAEAGRLDEAEPLAREATARFPLVPGAWLDLAHVCRLRTDVAGERAALGQALQINSRSEIAAQRLAESHERAGEFPRAREILERAIAASPLEATSHGSLASILWQLGEREAAVARLEHAVNLSPGYAWGWSTLSDWLRVLGRPLRVAEMARDLVARRPGDPTSWSVLARALEGPETLEERLQALERAVSLDVSNWEAHDLRATLLAEAGRYDDALAACCPASLGGSPPPELRGRLAWVHALRGSLKEAIAFMRTVVEEDPAYRWGWACLADWYEQSGDVGKQVEAAQALLHLAPNAAAAHRYLGDARLRAKDREGARAAYARAIELDPDNPAGFSLLEMRINDSDLDGASSLLECLRPHMRAPLVCRFETLLALRRKEFPEAIRSFAALCRDREADEWCVNTAASAMFDSSVSREADAALDGIVRESAAGAPAAALWASRCVEKGRWWRLRRGLPHLDRESEGWHGVHSTLVQALGEGQHSWVFRWLFWKEHDRYLQRTSTWGAAGYAFVALGRYRRAAQWMSDWERRHDLEPWMLTNLAEALRRCGRDAAAMQANRRALELPRDHVRGNHAVWVAFEEAISGHREMAEKWRREYAFDDLRPYYRFVHLLAEALLKQDSLQETNPEGAFEAASSRLQTAAESYPFFRRVPELMRAWRATVRRIAARRGGFFARLWSGWRMLG